jgi:hypothetical protein
MTRPVLNETPNEIIKETLILNTTEDDHTNLNLMSPGMRAMHQNDLEEKKKLEEESKKIASPRGRSLSEPVMRSK